MEYDLDKFKETMESLLQDAMGKDLPALDNLRVRMLGKKGEITQMLKALGSLDPEQRKEFGQKAHTMRRLFEKGMEDARNYLLSKTQEESIGRETLDVTLPSHIYAHRRGFGKAHPLSAAYDQIINLFIGLGFTVAEGPHIETDYYNFEALNTPPNHPSRDEQDTFYITDDIVLRTHMSPVQVRVMEKTKPPIRIVAPGKVFRSDEVDATHTPVFHQMEGLVVDKGITLGDLKGIQEIVASHIFGEGTQIRFRPSYFPFTEPSAEVDVTCFACHGSPSSDGCRVCKDSGWVEMWGCGMVHPKVLEMSGIDPMVYSGYAFGMGIDRIVSTNYGITDPRPYFENDINFLSQF